MAKKTPKPHVTTENFGRVLLEGAREMLAVHEGRVKPTIKTVTVREIKSVAPPPRYTPADIRHIRRNVFHVSQPLFAKLLSTSASTVQSWEQGKRVPDPMARRLLQFASTMAEREPEALQQVLQPGG